MASVSLINVSKKYGPATAVDRITLEVGAGEFLVLIGPAGAGKTSILKMIAGIEEASGGDILIGDAKVTAGESGAIDVAMIFETYALYPHLSVFENMAFPLKPRHRKIDPSEIKSRVGEVARLLEIDGLLPRHPAELSGGQKHRVALGRALVRRPKVFLMDEPLSHLDAKLRHQMRRELKKLKNKLQTSVIFVTHDYLEALSLADRIAVLDKGKLRQVGTPDEIYLSPRDTFVASLFGQPKINLVEGRVLSQDDRLLFTSGDGEIILPVPPALEGRLERTTPGKITAGIRPESIKFFQEQSTGAVRVSSFLSEYSGHKHLYHMQIGETSLTGIMGSGRLLKEQERLYISVEADKVIYFDHLGKRIEGA
jgi:multiple sugar transport system ATP-binding protein